MTLATLAIHVEAWLQEEVGAQRALLAILERVEAAACKGSGADLASSGRELEACLAATSRRDARRSALFARLATALGLAPEGLTMSGLCARLAAQEIDTTRLEPMRAELRELVRSVVRSSRRLAALAQYHRGFLEELCQCLRVGSPSSEGHLLDARA
jgi:hypothetical protein